MLLSPASKLNVILAVGHLGLYIIIRVSNPRYVQLSAISNCLISVDYHAVSNLPTLRIFLYPYLSLMGCFFTFHIQSHICICSSFLYALLSACFSILASLFRLPNSPQSSSFHTKWNSHMQSTVSIVLLNLRNSTIYS